MYTLVFSNIGHYNLEQIIELICSNKLPKLEFFIHRRYQ